MTFNAFATKRVSRSGQYDGVDDLITLNLRGDKRTVFRQFVVEEFHFSAIWKFFDPLFVRHFRITSGEVRVSRASSSGLCFVFDSNRRFDISLENRQTT